ncbi:MAG TPA: aspartyl beta-hydroxylase [Caulobacteraceae bacterium]|nr:aspartyl beta-hydroxylase [Caulobacteraceae bacterium]
MGSEASTDWRLAARERLRTLVCEDAALAASLAEIWNPDDFTARLAAAAGRDGAAIDAREIGDLLRLKSPPPAPIAPPPGWLPARVAGEGRDACVEWVRFGARRLLEPFYEESLAAVIYSPFNRLFGFSTRLAELAPPADALEPTGLVFHMSRCGSTLVAQLLAALAETLVVSEAPPIDAVVRLDASAADVDAVGHAELLRAMVGAFGRPRAGETRFLLKLDSWHTRALPLFRRAFPRTPWIFLIREPVEVLVSHLRRPGMQAAGLLPAGDIGAGWRGEASREANTAAALAAICEGAEQAFGAGGGLVVNYAELPAGLWTRILPHFGVRPSAADLAAMAAAAGRDAKQPASAFTPDAGAKQAAATEEVRTAVAGRLESVYSRLEALRRTQSPVPTA